MKMKQWDDARKRCVQFAVGDYVMVSLKKSRLQKGVPIKLQMKRIGPCEILAKYGNKAYKVDLPLDMNISSVFNVADLIKFKGTSNETNFES